MRKITNQKVISNRLWMLTIEYVTYEASQNVHSYSYIEFTFPENGVIESDVGVFTMKLNQYQSSQDMVRLGLELVYCVLLVGNIVIFLRKILNKNSQYNRWKKLEIDSLSEIERKQRHKKMPEFLRKWGSLFSSFTYFDIIYFTLAITSIVLWLLYL